MANKARQLDTPFRPGERVLTTVTVGDISEGARGKVRLANGIGPWRRYWVTFDGGVVRGQISHDDLVRPDQLDAWRRREEERAEAALRSESTQAAEIDAPAGGGEGGGDGGVASQIPAALLERSRAAKARLLG